MFHATDIFLGQGTQVKNIYLYVESVILIVITTQQEVKNEDRNGGIIRVFVAKTYKTMQTGTNKLENISNVDADKS